MRYVRDLRATRALLLAAAVLIGGLGPGEAAILNASNGAELQNALYNALPGDTILLKSDATFVGNFTLPAKSCPAEGGCYITVRSSAPDTSLPAAGVRIQPSVHSQYLPKIKSPNTSPALRTEAGAHHWRLMFLEFYANAQGAGDILALGDGSSAQNSLTQVPYDLIVDRVIIRGDPQFGQKRGIALNSRSTSILNSHIAGIQKTDQESHAIGGWNGPGPFLIENNFLEAAGVNVMFGGADPSIRNLVPSDITVRANHMTKRHLEWRADPKPVVKNLFELKNARRVLIEYNVLEFNWQAAQSGYAVLFTPRNQGGRAPWSVVEDVDFRFNIVRHVAAGINILGRDNVNKSEVTKRIRIADNLFYDVDAAKWGGSGAFLQMGDGPEDVTVDHNTVIHTGTAVSAYGGPANRPTRCPRFVFTNNLARHNDYGIKGDGRATGTDTINSYFPDGTLTKDVLAGGPGWVYPAGFLFPTIDAFEAQFVNYASADYHLVKDSMWRNAGTDGRDLGADMAKADKAALAIRAQ